MDRVLDTALVVSQTVQGYVVSSFNAKLIYSENSADRIYSVIVVPDDWRENPHVMIMAQIIGDQVVVLTDRTDRPLDKALTHAGIPRDKIVIAYRGEVLSAS